MAPVIVRWLKYILVCALTVLAACFSLQKQNNNSAAVDLQSLLAQFPGRDSTHQLLLSKELSLQGSNSITRLVNLLESDKEDEKLRTQYALSAMTDYYGKRADASGRSSYNRILEAGINGVKSDETQLFLINQLSLCGDEKSYHCLIGLLDSEVMFTAILRAIQMINPDEAGEYITNKLTDLPENRKTDAIYALADLNYYPSAEHILPYLIAESDALRRAALYALSSFGYENAESFLRENLKGIERSHAMYAVQDYVRLIINMPDSKRKTELCQEVIRNEQNIYAIHQQLAVFQDRILHNDSHITEYAQLLLRSDNLQLRTHTLKFLNQIPGSQMTQWFIAQAENSGNTAEYIYILGERRDRLALPYLRKILKSSSGNVFSETLSALRKMNDFIPLIEQMKLSHNPGVCFQISGELSYFPKDTLRIGIEDLVENAQATGCRTAVIDLIKRHQLQEYNQFLKECLTATDSLIRISAIKAYQAIGDTSAIQLLFNHMLTCADESEKNITSGAISILIDRCTDHNNLLLRIKEMYTMQDGGDKAQYFRLLSAVGGADAYHYLLAESEANDPQVSEAILNTLYEWPDIFAIDTLISLAGNSQDIRQHIKSIRGCLRIIRENDLPDSKKLKYYRQMITLCRRQEEKQMLIADAAKLTVPDAFDFIAEQLDEKEIQEVTITALFKMIDENKSVLSAGQVAKSLISVGAGQEIVDQVMEMAQYPELNKPPEGFRALFNGKDLTGWQGLVENPVLRNRMSKNSRDSLQLIADEVMRSHWYVENGILRFDGGGSNLCTTDEFTDFELLLEWKIEKNGDSGIYLRGMPQVQIKDPDLPNGGSGGLYNNIVGESQPLEIADRPVGEWNKFRIVMKGSKVTVYLNGRLVVDQVRMENYWERDQLAYDHGPIELQAHNHQLYFRNIFIRELPVNEPVRQALLSNDTLQEWQIIDGAEDSWHISNGILSTDGTGGGWLSTRHEFSDFELDFEFRVSSGGNSGIFIRSPHTGDPAYTGIEIQILDDYAPEYANLKPWQYTGSLYGIIAPAEKSSQQGEKWQKMKITCDGPVIKVVLNDRQIIDTNLVNFMWQEENHPGIKNRKGHIGLQAHGSNIEYRNIFLMEL